MSDGHYYEVVIEGARPKRPAWMTARAWTANLNRLGFMVGSAWEVRPRTLRSIHRVWNDGHRTRDEFDSFRAKDASWAVERALSCWRSEINLLIQGQYPYAHQSLRISVRAASGENDERETG